MFRSRQKDVHVMTVFGLFSLSLTAVISFFPLYFGCCCCAHSWSLISKMCLRLILPHHLAGSVCTGMSLTWRGSWTGFKAMPLCQNHSGFGPVSVLWETTGIYKVSSVNELKVIFYRQVLLHLPSADSFQRRLCNKPSGAVRLQTEKLTRQIVFSPSLAFFFHDALRLLTFLIPEISLRLIQPDHQFTGKTGSTHNLGTSLPSQEFKVSQSIKSDTATAVEKT